ncbi:MAG: cyclic-di-AMP receptor [Chitinophagales bacterium]
MKLVIAIVNEGHAVEIVDRLVEKGFRVTRLSSTGGYMRKGSATLFSGVPDEEVIMVTKVIKDYVEFQKIKALNENDEEEYQRLSATIFILPIEEMLQVSP